MTLDPSQDGITHINIYSKGRTELGRQLSNFAYAPVILPEGTFLSLEGYWYYLLSNQDKEAEPLKNLYGWKAKEYGRSLKIRDYPLKKNVQFFHKFLMAMEEKLNQHPRIMLLLEESNLPFTHYYCYSGKVIKVKDCEWMLDAWSSWREELKDTCI